MEKTIYDLNLHEKMEEKGFQIIRVPGGWLYFNETAHVGISGTQRTATSTFVPYNDEFKDKDD